MFYGGFEARELYKSLCFYILLFFKKFSKLIWIGVFFKYNGN